jgi:hypothetical protein
LEIEDQVGKIAMQLVDGVSKEIGFEHAGGASEGT